MPHQLAPDRRLLSLALEVQRSCSQPKDQVPLRRHHGRLEYCFRPEHCQRLESSCLRLAVVDIKYGKEIIARGMLRASKCRHQYLLLTPYYQVELILHCDSMTELLRLLLVAPRPKTIAVTLFWLFLNIVIILRLVPEFP